MAAIALNRVDKFYQSGKSSFHAVKALDLDIPDGEFLVLLGPSGCGKSTTLRMIAGLEDASDGTISIGGRVVNDVHPKDRDIAMVFQNYALYPHMTVRDNMAFALKMRKTPKQEIQRRVGAVSEMLGLSELLDRKPAALSGGQRQRVAVGRAIVREPKAFLFDEPLSNLDAKLRTSTRGELKALHQRLKTTTVYVTHDQEEAMTLGDRIAIMAGGVLRQQGSPMELYRRPVDRFVAGFLGTPPMNFLDGRVEMAGGSPVFVQSGGAGSSGVRVTLPGEWAAKLGGHVGKDVVLGVRPQGMELVAVGASGPMPAAGSRPTVQMNVAIVEPLGDQMDLICRPGAGGGAGVGGAGAGEITAKPFIARVPAHDMAANQLATFAIDMTRAHVFEAGEFGRNLTV